MPKECSISVRRHKHQQQNVRTNGRRRKKTPLLCILHGRHWHFLPLLELTDEWLGKTVHGFNGIICAMAFILYVIKFQQTNEKSVWKTMQQWHEEDVEKRRWRASGRVIHVRENECDTMAHFDSWNDPFTNKTRNWYRHRQTEEKLKEASSEQENLCDHPTAWTLPSLRQRFSSVMWH